MIADPTAPAPTFSAYVHFPYCLEKCPYCDFVSYRLERERIEHRAYADAVLREMAARAPGFVRPQPDAPARRLGSVFFGGGTPSLWEPAELGRVLAGLRAQCEAVDDLEVSVECNPTSLDRDRADALAEVGVNRLSIGVQSLDADELRFLGRLHDAAGALRALDDALGSRIDRVSADLIVGLPEQAPEAAAAQAARLADLGLRHLSVYQLTIEPGTRFGELAKVGRLPMADDGRVAECFLAVHEALQSRGLRHYEISNFAEPGQEARHNLAYWRGHDYLGLGTGAVGCLRRGLGAARYRNEVVPERYIEKTHAVRPGAYGDDGLATGGEELDAEALLRERIMLGLRLVDGFDLEAAAAELGVDPYPEDRKRALRWLEERGRLLRQGPRLRIAPSAWLFTDDTAARLF